MKKGPSGESILLIRLKREWGGMDAMPQLQNGGGEVFSELERKSFGEHDTYNRLLFCGL